MFNPVFTFLVILGVIILWFLLSFVFPILGGFILRVGRDTKYNLNKEDKKTEKEEVNADEER